MATPDPYAPIIKLAVLVNLARERARQAELPEGRQEQLQILAHRIHRIRSLQEGKDTKIRVGVFGAPKRGKSTLLNALLGEELMPTAQVPLSTTTIEIERDTSIPGRRVIIDHPSGRIEERDCKSAQEVAKLLETYGSRRGTSESALRLRLKGDFPDCKILAEGGVLLDTPGAEVAFEPDKKLAAEAQRALDALKSTHLVLFCMRADQIGSRSDSELYEKHVRSLAPVHVVTMKDKYEGDIGNLIDDVLKNYGLTQAEPTLVSAHQAMSDETLGISGMAQFEEKVLREIGRITPEHGLLSCLRNFELAAEDFSEIRPERIHFMNLYGEIEGLNNDWSSEAIKHMRSKPEFWKL